MGGKMGYGIWANFLVRSRVLGVSPYLSN